MANALLAQLSDLHMRVGPGDGVAARRLEATVRAVLALDRTPDAVLVSGDLAEHGSPAEYERVRELLAPLPMPVHALPGNHDDREALRAHFAGSADGELIRYSVDCGELRLVLCDTTLPGVDPGSLDPDRLAWLDRELSADAERPTIVAMHHPPLLTGVRELDEIGLPVADRRALAELLARHPQVLRVLAGHVHRAVVGSLGACPVFACPSTFLQAVLDLDAGLIELVPEPAAFALHLELDGELFSHVQTVDDQGFRAHTSACQ